jgi:hypothetical protein
MCSSISGGGTRPIKNRCFDGFIGYHRSEEEMAEYGKSSIYSRLVPKTPFPIYNPKSKI